MRRSNPEKWQKRQNGFQERKNKIKHQEPFSLHLKSQNFPFSSEHSSLTCVSAMHEEGSSLSEKNRHVSLLSRFRALTMLAQKQWFLFGLVISIALARMAPWFGAKGGLSSSQLD